MKVDGPPWINIKDDPVSYYEWHYYDYYYDGFISLNHPFTFLEAVQFLAFRPFTIILWDRPVSPLCLCSLDRKLADSRTVHFESFGPFSLTLMESPLWLKTVHFRLEPIMKWPKLSHFAIFHIVRSMTHFFVVEGKNYLQRQSCNL